LNAQDLSQNNQKTIVLSFVNMSSKPIRRITLFKIPNEEDQQKLLAKYKTMPQDAVKVQLPWKMPIPSIKSFTSESDPSSL
jgi:hypothetical protein